MTDVFSSIEFQISILLFVSLMAYFLAARLNQAVVIGQIILGIIIGPTVLGLVTYTDFVKSIAHFGAVILLFVIGLEFRLKDIVKGKYLLIALAGVIIPWLAGYGFAKIYDYPFTTAVFVGTALTATSIAITANTLKELNLLQSETAKAIIGAAVIDDILGLLLLAFSGQLVENSINTVEIFLIIGKAFAFLIVGVAVGYVLLNRILTKIDQSAFGRKYTELAFIFTIASIFVYSMLAEAIGLSAIVGAFLVGVSLEGVVLFNSQSYKHGAEYLRIIFGSIFFVSLGIIVDLRNIDFSFILFILIMTVVAIVTKVVGCGIPAKLAGLSTKDSIAVGVGMAPRGEVAMIVALIGLNQGIIGQDIYISLVIMSLLTTMIVPVVYKNFLYTHAQPLAIAQPLKDESSFSPPKGSIGGKTMGKIETLFGIVLVLTVLCGALLLGVSAYDVDATETDVTQTTDETEKSLTTSEIILDNQLSAPSSTSEVVEFDVAGEMQYLYMQSENIDASFAELNELQERLYDIAEDYDQVEYDMLQEKIDNGRTVAKYTRDTQQQDPFDRASGDGEADEYFVIH